MENKRQARIISGHPIPTDSERTKKFALVELQVGFNAAQLIRRHVPVRAFVDQLSKISRYAAGEEGDYVASKSSKVNLHDAERKEFCAQELFATKPSCADLKMKRANEYATPTHNARMTKAYSVSFPV